MTMPVAFNEITQRMYLYPVASEAKFARRLRPEEGERGGPGVHQRTNKLGERVYERFYNVVRGRIVDFSIVQNERIADPQYQVIVMDPSDPSVEGCLSFGARTSLGRQLINQLLSVTPEMLRHVITFTLRHVEGGRGVYLNLYQGKSIAYENLIPRRFKTEEIPKPEEIEPGRWDYSRANDFFLEKARELADKWKTLVSSASEEMSSQNTAMNSAYGSDDEQYFPDDAPVDYPTTTPQDDVVPF
jgi:hypothetical protein